MMTETEVRQLVKEELMNEAGRGRVSFGELKDQYPDGTLITDPHIVKDTAQMLTQEGVLDEGQVGYYESFYWTGGSLLGGVSGTKVWGSHDKPRESMMPTESVKFKRLHP